MSRRTLTRAPDPHMPPPVAIATRRDLFGTMGALLLLSAAEAGPAKAAELACCAEAHLLEGKAAKVTKDAYELRERARQLPARTPEGLQAKARIVLERLEVDSQAAEVALSLARDVLGRIGA